MSKKRMQRELGKEGGLKLASDEILRQSKENAKRYDALARAIRGDNDTVSVKITVSENGEEALFMDMLFDSAHKRFVVFYEAYNRDYDRGSSLINLINTNYTIGDLELNADEVLIDTDWVDLLEESAADPGLNPEMAARIAEAKEEASTAA